EDECAEEYSYKTHELESVAFGDTERQMEVLSNLPQLISGSHTDVDLAVTLVGLLLKAIPPSIAVAVAVFDETDVQDIRCNTTPDAPLPKPKLMRVQTRDDFHGRFMPSRKLLRKALRLNESVMHIVGDITSSGNYTMSDTLGWAFCAPITSEASVGWCLYVAGEGGRDHNSFVDETTLKGDLRFTQLVAQFIGSIRTVRTLQEQTTQMASFFSPKVIANLTKKSAGNVLEPSERDITVLFCDVRGFSRKSEKLKDDLHTLLESVRAALSAMTGGILAFDGAIADFQGDAALGFWGWPQPLPDGPISACQAALAIQQVFNLPPEEQGLLEGFSCGVGIAHGRAIAGQIGTAQQAKIGVFGPVVNQGSRIEGMTRMFGVGVCIDEATATFVRKMLSPSEGRCRRLAKLRPKGMDTALTVSELLPPDDGTCQTTAAVVQAYEAALDAVIAGQWDQALRLLKDVPDSDGPKIFLLDRFSEHGNTPPPDWDGAFSLTSK
ncbi:MAG TPA: adenylate/guanylate cyclase domain-containing protein, partial [Planctomycetaceae bacterium]|nr:adenylate/guanylate cyclase domain-containing protein [Planctomycetaceae bacterium]